MDINAADAIQKVLPVKNEIQDVIHDEGVFILNPDATPLNIADVINKRIKHLRVLAELGSEIGNENFENSGSGSASGYLQGVLWDKWREEKISNGEIPDVELPCILAGNVDGHEEG